MKKILKYISLLAGVAFLTAACSQSDIDGNASEEMGTLRLSVNIGGSRADAYNALDRSIMRVYKIENGEEKLIRKYQPATEAPGDFYLVAGSYRIKVEAGDQSQATFTNKSYYGELDVDIEPQQTVLKEVVCPTTNIGVKVVFDQTILDKMDPGFKAYVSAIDTFSKTEAENGSVPTLKYTENATGYYLLPEDVHNLSWGFYSSSTELGSVSKTGVIPTPESGNLYTLTFKYSKTPNGYLGITVQVDQDGEIHEDPFIFSPQPTIKGDGFDINSVIGFNTDDISFAVSSVQALSGISIKANDETIQVLSDGALLPEAAAKGISYTKTDDNSGKLSLGGTFFSTFAGGIHEVEFTMTDVAQAEGTGKARIATPGLTDLAVYDLWLNTADFQVIVTDPALTNVKVRYRERERLAESPAFGEWKTVTAVAGADYTYTAQAIDFAADRDYEYQLLINDAETGEIHNFSAATGIQLPNAGFETWTNSKTWYPCSADEIGSNGMGTGYTGFWGTGNPGANAAGIVVTEPADDPRSGIDREQVRPAQDPERFRRNRCRQPLHRSLRRCSQHHQRRCVYGSSVHLQRPSQSDHILVQRDGRVRRQGPLLRLHGQMELLPQDRHERPEHLLRSFPGKPARRPHLRPRGLAQRYLPKRLEKDRNSHQIPQ